MASVLQEFLTVFGFEYDDEALDKMESAVWSKVKALGVAVGATTAAIYGLSKATGALFNMAEHTANVGDEARDMADKMGVSATMVQELGFAAELTSTSAEAMMKTMRQLQRRTYEAANGNKQFAQSFALAGIAVRNADGSIRDIESVYADVADSIAGTEDSTKRSALAFRLMGRAGTEVLPFLMKGSDGIAALRDEAAGLGFILNNEATRAGEDFRAELVKMRAALGGITNRIGMILIPIFDKMVKGIIKWIRENQGLITSLIGLGKTILEWTLVPMLRLLGFLANHLTLVAAFFGAMSLGALGAAIVVGKFLIPAFLMLAQVTTAMFKGSAAMLFGKWALFALILAAIIDELFGTLTGYNSIMTDWLNFGEQHDPEDNYFVKVLRTIVDLMNIITGVKAFEYLFGNPEGRRSLAKNANTNKQYDMLIDQIPEEDRRNYMRKLVASTPKDDLSADWFNTQVSSGAWRGMDQPQKSVIQQHNEAAGITVNNTPQITQNFGAHMQPADVRDATAQALNENNGSLQRLIRQEDMRTRGVETK